MRIIVQGGPKELAAFVVALQEQKAHQGDGTPKAGPSSLIRQAVEEGLRSDALRHRGGLDF